MKNIKFVISVLSLLLFSAFSLAQNPPSATPPVAPLNDLQVPDGFKISVFAEGLPTARLMTVAPDGTLFVARMGKPDTGGEVIALRDLNKDGKADRIEVIASGFNRSHSLAFHKGYLYIATMPAVMRVKYENGKAGAPKKFIDLPVSTTSHWSRSIAWGKDNRLYVAIGSSCNVCEETDDRRTSIMVYNEDGSGGKHFAKGLRNAIGIAFDPKTNKLWSDDMGQDKLGEDMPPDEINLIEDGKNYGFPYYVGKNIPNAGLENAKGSLKASDATPPAFEFPAHSSPIDLKFYTGKQFPAAYRGAMLVAIHGSGAANRKEKIGYKVVRVMMKDGKPVSTEDFVTGWLKDAQISGRPAGLMTGADGALYISDDNKGFIYRVTYNKK